MFLVSSFVGLEICLNLLVVPSLKHRYCHSRRLLKIKRVQISSLFCILDISGVTFTYVLHKVTLLVDVSTVELIKIAI